LILKRGYNTLRVRLRPAHPSAFLAVLLLVTSHAFASEKLQVAVGIDVLEKQKFAPLRRPDGRDARIALVTNATGVDAHGQRTIDVLAKASGIKVLGIFSPEHGIATNSDTTAIGDSKDESTGISVYSVYGKSDAERRPRPELLRGLDAIVFDLQDAGARFYTYETTLGYFLEACAGAGVEMIVLDRPNPINGVAVQGPVSNAPQSFVNYHPLPVRHGMTLGELARFLNAQRKIGAKLRVISMEGWKRTDWFDETGVPWVNPSPALRNVNAEALYPGVALLEQTNVSAGRGTVTPFEIVGAPWVDGEKLATYMNGRKIPGVSLKPTVFSPVSSTLASKNCQGVTITVTDRDALDSPALGIELAAALLHLYPKQFESAGMKSLLASDTELKKLQNGVDPKRIIAGWERPLRAFRKVRRQYLLYPELR
jgi:uncharacterized protein YbbC (DUF1343 family)